MPRVLRAIARRLGLCTPLSPPWCGDEGAVLPSVGQPFVRVAALAMTVEPTVAVQKVFEGFLVLRSGKDL